MRIIVLAVGRLRPPFADDVQHYQKLLAGHARVELIELRGEEHVARRVPDRAWVSLLDREGEEYDSIAFSRLIEERRQAGRDVCFVIGTVGFVVTEGTSVWTGFRWTLDTVATVGSIPPPHDLAGQVLIVALIVLGVGTLFYALVTATEFLVAGHLSGLLDERRTQRMIDALNDHYVICGFGRVGRQVARDLRAANANYVVVDADSDNRELAAALGVRFIEGRPSEDEILRAAGIERARAVLACVGSDPENIFITLSARELRDDITIVARASVEDSEKKLRRAGADRIISPYKASGSEMARFALHPQVTGAIDVAPEYRMEEIEVTAGAEGEGETGGGGRGGPGGLGPPRPPGAGPGPPPRR